MALNFLGIVSALTAFLGIWLGHVAVRLIEARSDDLRIPMFGTGLLGVGGISLSLLMNSSYLTAICGILGVVFIWDTLELYRQENRVKQGHAPANLDNPRHARILADHPPASVVDWLNRNPRGRAYTAEEIEIIAKGTK